MTANEESKGPVDRNGNQINLFDLVRIGTVPEHYYSDLESDDAEVIKGYEGKYGIVTVCPDHLVHQDDRGRANWFGNGDVYVVARSLRAGALVAFDFWLPAFSLLRLPHNSVLLGLFSDISIQIDGSYVLRDGMELFELMKMIMLAPYDKVVEANAAVIKCLTGN